MNTSDKRCCGSGVCIINELGECWCGQIWDGEKMSAPKLNQQPTNQNPAQEPHSSKLNSQ